MRKCSRAKPCGSASIRRRCIVRRHLAQKMAFVSDDLAVVAEPAEADLRAYFDAHRRDVLRRPTCTHCAMSSSIRTARHGARPGRAASAAEAGARRKRRTNRRSRSCCCASSQTYRATTSRAISAHVRRCSDGVRRRTPGPARRSPFGVHLGEAANRIRQAAWPASRTCAIACARRCLRRKAAGSERNAAREAAPTVPDRRRNRRRKRIMKLSGQALACNLPAAIASRRHAHEVRPAYLRNRRATRTASIR